MSKSKLEIKREFEAFASKIEKLESLRHELDALDVRGFETQAQHIRAKLSDVQALPQLEKDMAALRQAIAHRSAHAEHHETSDRKLSAESKKLRDDTQRLKQRMGQLKHLIEEKRKISCKKQLSSEEVSYVKDMPQLEKELISLKREFEAHMNLSHRKVDAGVGVLVDTHCARSFFSRADKLCAFSTAIFGSIKPVIMQPLSAPFLRKIRVNCRVSIFAIATIFCVFKNSKSDCVARQLLTMGDKSRIISPAACTRDDSKSSGLMPTLPMCGYVNVMICS